MARGRKKQDKTERVIKFTADEFKKSIVEAARLKEQAPSYSGYHGEHVKRFVEKTGFSRQAYGFLLKLFRLNDPMKQQSLMDEVVMGFDLLGMNDQGNLFDRVEQRKERDVVDADNEDETDLRPPFMRNAMPLDEAEAAFKKTEHLAPRPGDALSALAGDDDGFGAATQEVTAEETFPVTKAGKRTRVSKAELEAANKAGKAEVRGIGDVVLN